MGRRPRRNHSPAFKAKAAVSAIKGEKTLIEFAQEFDGIRTRSYNGVISFLKQRLVCSESL